MNNKDKDDMDLLLPHQRVALESLRRMNARPNPILKGRDVQDVDFTEVGNRTHHENVKKFFEQNPNVHMMKVIPDQEGKPDPCIHDYQTRPAMAVGAATPADRSVLRHDFDPMRYVRAYASGPGPLGKAARMSVEHDAILKTPDGLRVVDFKLNKELQENRMTLHVIDEAHHPVEVEEAKTEPDPRAPYHRSARNSVSPSMKLSTMLAAVAGFGVGIDVVNPFARLEPRTLTREEMNEAYKVNPHDQERQAKADAKRMRKAAKLKRDFEKAYKKPEHEHADFWKLQTLTPEQEQEVRRKAEAVGLNINLKTPN